MRRILMVAAAAAALSLTGLPGASATVANVPGIVAAAETIGVAQTVRRVCRDICREGYCRRRCWDEPERRVYREYYDDDDPPVVYERRRYYDPAPGVGIYGPGVGIRVGPGWGW